MRRKFHLLDKLVGVRYTGNRKGAVLVNLDELFNAHRAKLGENDLHIWNYVSAHRKECAELSIEALGQRCHVSRTTILRFARKLGLHGFSELKVLLRMEEKPETSPDYIEQTCAVYASMIEDIRAKDYTPLFRRIDQAENLYVFSSGMLQDAVARELCRACLACGKWSYTIHAGTEAEVLLHNVTERDLVIILSVSGESPHVLELARALKVRNIPAVSITRRRKNTLAQLCGLRLYASTIEMDTHTLGAEYQSTTSFFILVELLFLKYMAYHNQGGNHEAGKPDRTKLP